MVLFVRKKTYDTVYYTLRNGHLNSGFVYIQKIILTVSIVWRVVKDSKYQCMVCDNAE